MCSHTTLGFSGGDIEESLEISSSTVDTVETDLLTSGSTWSESDSRRSKDSFLMTSDNPGTCLGSCPAPGLAMMVPAELELLGPDIRTAAAAPDKLLQLILLLHLSLATWPPPDLPVSDSDPRDEDLTGDLTLDDWRSGIFLTPSECFLESETGLVLITLCLDCCWSCLCLIRLSANLENIPSTWSPWLGGR